MARSRRRRLWERISAGDTRNIGFAEFCRLVEAHGFTLRRVSGTHSRVARPLSLQPRQQQAKPYQIDQFVEIVVEFGLTMESRE